VPTNLKNTDLLQKDLAAYLVLFVLMLGFGERYLNRGGIESDGVFAYPIINDFETFPESPKF